jgi:hypothetical protein
MLLLTVSLCGCRLDLDVSMRVRADGGGWLAVALAADREALERAAQAGTDPLGLVVQAGQDLEDEGWTLTDETAPDGTREVELAVEAADAEDLSAQSAQLAEALSAPEVALLEPLVVRAEEERILVNGAASLLPGDAVADYGLSAADAVRLLGERDALDYSVTVTLPAEVLSSDAAAVDESTLTWVVEPGQRTPITAEGVRPRFPWLIVIGVSAAVLLVALIVLSVRQRGPRENRTRGYGLH